MHDERTSKLANDRPGKWSAEEETHLRTIFQEKIQSGHSPKTTPKFWKEVSIRMGNTRTAKQCSNKWYEHFKRLPNADLTSPKERIALTRCQEDSSLASRRFAHPRPEVRIWSSSLTRTNQPFRISLLNVQEDDEIRWEDLTDEHWKGWTAEKLRRRWVELKAGVHTPNDTHHGESQVSGW